MDLNAMIESSKSKIPHLHCNLVILVGHRRQHWTPSSGYFRNLQTYYVKVLYIQNFYIIIKAADPSKTHFNLIINFPICK